MFYAGGFDGGGGAVYAGFDLVRGLEYLCFLEGLSGCRKVIVGIGMESWV